MLLTACPAQAAKVSLVTVDHDGNRYSVRMQAFMAVAPAAAHQAFTSYERLPEINNSVERAQRLPDAPPGAVRLDTTVRVCVAFFCKHLHQVQDLRASRKAGDYGLVADVLPQRSDVRYGHAQWSMRACKRGEAAGTCLDFSAQLEPDFWVPPVIGPWLIQRKMRGEARQTAEGIEKVANEQARQKPKTD